MAMAAVSTQTEKMIAQRIPGEKSSQPLLAFVAGWLVPGAGHLLVGKWGRALLLFVSILGMYLTGLALVGKVYTLGSSEILDLLGFVGELGSGVLYGAARLFSLGGASAQTTLNDFGTKFLIAAGLLNLIAAADAHSLASGRKAR